MKYLKWLVIALIFVACEDEPETRCWDCDTLMTYETTGLITQEETVSFVVCDFTENEIRIFEAARTFTVRVNTGSRIAVNIQETKCK